MDMIKVCVCRDMIEPYLTRNQSLIKQGLQGIIIRIHKEFTTVPEGTGSCKTQEERHGIRWPRTSTTTTSYPPTESPTLP